MGCGERAREKERVINIGEEASKTGCGVRRRKKASKIII
jgi:hypothetical protein